MPFDLHNLTLKQCRLCFGQHELLESHFVPAFVYRWMKKSGTGRLRDPSAPNQPRQDGRKLPFLCEVCEERFNKPETWFASTVFHPAVMNRTLSRRYGPDLYYFCVSVLWRYLALSVLEDPAETWGGYGGELALAERSWRSYLLGTSPPKHSKRVHLARLESFVGEQPYPGTNMYLRRAVDAAIGSGPNQCFVYVKLPRFIILGLIRGGDSRKLTNSKVEPLGGVFKSPTHMADGEIGRFVVERSRLMWDLFWSKLSPEQRKQIDIRGEKLDLEGSDYLDAYEFDRATPAAPHKLP